MKKKQTKLTHYDGMKLVSVPTRKPAFEGETEKRWNLLGKFHSVAAAKEAGAQKCVPRYVRLT